METFKILVVAAYWTNNGVAIHQTVIGFQRESDAETAVYKIRDSGNTSLTVIPLYHMDGTA